jgi:hypothetical protein
MVRAARASPDSAFLYFYFTFTTQRLGLGVGGESPRRHTHARRGWGGSPSHTRPMRTLRYSHLAMCCTPYALSSATPFRSLPLSCRHRPTAAAWFLPARTGPRHVSPSTAPPSYPRLFHTQPNPILDAASSSPQGIPGLQPRPRKMQHFHRSNQLFIQVGMRPLCAVRMCLTIPSRARQGIQSSGETAPVMGEPLTTSRASPADGFSRPATGAQMFGKGLLAIYTIAGS